MAAAGSGTRRANWRDWRRIGREPDILDVTLMTPRHSPRPVGQRPAAGQSAAIGSDNKSCRSKGQGAHPVRPGGSQDGSLTWAIGDHPGRQNCWPHQIPISGQPGETAPDAAGDAAGRTSVIPAGCISTSGKNAGAQAQKQSKPAALRNGGVGSHPSAGKIPLAGSLARYPPGPLDEHSDRLEHAHPRPARP